MHINEWWIFDKIKLVCTLQITSFCCLKIGGKLQEKRNYIKVNRML